MDNLPFISPTSTRLCTNAMERIEQFELDVARRVEQRMPLSYALAYVEHYTGDVPNLEREREFLLAVLAQAWGQERYTQVVQLMKGLASLAGRLGNNDVGRRMLTWGIQSCQQTHDRYSLASFLSCLSGLLWSQGKYDEARQTWTESMAIASDLGRPACLWEPLYNVVHIADMLDNYSTVQRFADKMLQTQGNDGANSVNSANSMDSVVAAQFLRGFFARCDGELDRAYDDYNSCLHPLTAGSPATSSPCSSRQFFTFEIQTELARVQRDCIHAQQHTATTISFAQRYCDPYTIAILLIDQLMFAYYTGQLSEARPLLQHLFHLTPHIGAPHLRDVANFFWQKFQPVASGLLSQPCNAAIASSSALHGCKEEQVTSSPFVSSRKPSKEQRRRYTLSSREVEILQLVASGLSNRDIADQLVISVTTVKKHLEHINDRLDTHSRTQAVAVARADGIVS